MNTHKKAGRQPGSSEKLSIKHLRRNGITKNIKFEELDLRGLIPTLIKSGRMRRMGFICKPIRKRHYDSSQPAFAEDATKSLWRAA